MNPIDDRIARLLGAYREAVLACDVDAFMRLYDADVRVFDAWGVWSYEGAPAWRKAVEQWLTTLGDERVRVSFDEVRVTGDAEAGAVVSAVVTYAGHAADGTALRAMQNRLTWALRRAGDGWAIVHEHTSAPISFDESKAILQRAAT